MEKQYRFETLAVHVGQEPDPATGAITPPIYQTSTYALDDPNKRHKYGYGRSGNPTRSALEANIAALEGAAFGLVFASGMAATDAVIRLLKSGQHLIIHRDLYGGTFKFFEKVLKAMGLGYTYTDLTDVHNLQATIQPNTRLIWLETPSNPYLQIIDIAAVAQVAQQHGLMVAVDSTFASPFLQQPLRLGADIVVHSTSKYLNGHSDLIGGCIAVNNQTLHDELRFLQKMAGAIPGPQDCWLTQRGIKTLHLRMERHCSNARMLAAWLANHPAVAKVIYPGLPDHPQHKIAQAQMSDFGGMISLFLHGGRIAAEKLVTRTQIFTLALSLGAVESLIEIPAALTHAGVTDPNFQIDPGLVRLSVGVEHIDDLREDLGQALREA